jgi:AmmeMemoRadiSam system protein A
MTIDVGQRRQLLALGRTSIEAGLRRGAYVEPQLQDAPPELLERRASFVTLHLAGELRGCIGTLDAARPLAEDVWRNAYGAAFSDPRFPPLTASEWSRCTLHASVLTPPTPMLAQSEQDLLAQLRPGVDGLILELGASRATFLPVVWEQARDPAQFVRQLKLKAGWRADFWSPEIRAQRYESESFGED